MDGERMTDIVVPVAEAAAQPADATTGSAAEDKLAKPQTTAPADKAEEPKEDGEASVEKGRRKNEDEDKDKDEDEDEDEDTVVVGMVCEQKAMYQKFDKHGRFTWVETKPDDLEEAAENKETEKFAVLVRFRKSYDARKMVELDSIVVQSPLLKRILHTVLACYPGVTTTLQRLVFDAPFQPFVHRWSELVAARDSAELDAASRAHMELLYRVLHAELKDVIAALADYRKTGVVTYEHAWTVFQPGTLMMTSKFGQPVANRFRLGQYTDHPRLGPCFEVAGDRLEHDGFKFGLASSRTYIAPFVGTCAINTLAAYPIEFAADADAVRATLAARGRRYTALAGWHYRAYKGFAIETTAERGPVRIAVDGRIVVDAAMHGNYNADRTVPLKPLHEVAVVHGRADDEICYSDYGDASDADGDSAFGAFGGFELVDATGDVQAEQNARIAAQAASLTDDELLLASPVVKGFSLRSKKWLEFFVDDVVPVAFDDAAFDRLVLPADQKRLVLAFAQSQTKNRHRFDDVIAGKGRGIIMLLSGGPGIGKTLTAESVAEAMRVPLFVLSSGELGGRADEIEHNLQRTLEIVGKWNAVLLIDECDVFLEARSAASLERNRIVSVFLRMLEYYEGILFLTTNRVDNIDDAIHSRIHISLHYPDLDAAARHSVWAGFLGDAGGGDALAGHALTAAELERLANVELNGRQIKNVVKAGRLLAFQDGKQLDLEHLVTVLGIYGKALE